MVFMVKGEVVFWVVVVIGGWNVSVIVLGGICVDLEIKDDNDFLWLVVLVGYIGWVFI